jgi:hypothetical protein
MFYIYKFHFTIDKWISQVHIIRVCLTLNICKFRVLSSGERSLCKQTHSCPNWEFRDHIFIFSFSYPFLFYFPLNSQFILKIKPRANKNRSMLSQSSLVRQKMMPWSILCSWIAFSTYSPFKILTASERVSGLSVPGRIWSFPWIPSVWIRKKILDQLIAFPVIIPEWLFLAGNGA